MPHSQPTRCDRAPDAIDEATGERIEGTAQIVDTRHVAFAEQDEDNSAEVDDPQFEDQDHLSEEDRDPIFEVRLADTFEEINTTPYEVILKQSSKSLRLTLEHS